MNTPEVLLGGKPKRLLAEAAEWHLLSLLFSCPQAEWRRTVAQLASEVADTSLRSAARQALTESSEGLYHSVFGPGGPAPAREVSYDGSVQLGLLMSELSAYYQAFAYNPVTQEPLDHISVELGFVAYLKLKQAYALANSDSEHAAVAAEAAQSFIEKHVSPMAAALSPALNQLGVKYLAAAITVLVSRAGPPASRPELPLPVIPSDSDDCECAPL
jgi:nitrate reductase assembly molybdenum cofactor insertion protein NarJ